MFPLGRYAQSIYMYKLKKKKKMLDVNVRCKIGSDNSGRAYSPPVIKIG